MNINKDGDKFYLIVDRIAKVTDMVEDIGNCDEKDCVKNIKALLKYLDEIKRDGIKTNL